MRPIWTRAELASRTRPSRRLYHRKGDCLEKEGGIWVEVCLFNANGLLEDGVRLSALGNKLAVGMHRAQIPRDRSTLE